MAPSRERNLPERRNPLITGPAPDCSELAAKRRLGQTQLTARMVATVPGAAIDPTTLGIFDYAHLRAPLPKGIVSGIFKSSPNSYFLMRRSHDGFVSATGMFKATFPYAMAEDEEAERRFIKSLSDTSPEETAGNVWIPPEAALALAEEYGIKPWIQALLDPAEIQLSNSTSENSPQKKINAPPKFIFRGASPTTLVPPTPTRNSRSRRSASPTKSTASRRGGPASPRKRSTRITASQVDAAESSSGTSSHKNSLTNGDIPVLVPGEPLKVEDVKIEAAEREPLSTLEPVEEEPKVKVNIHQEIQTDEDGTAVKHTNFELEVPFTAGIPSPDDARRMIEEARNMVNAAAAEAEAEAEAALTQPKSKAAKSKRKAEELEADNEDEAGAESSLAVQPRAKRVKTQVEVRKQKVRRRALWGISLTLAAGAAG
ncbi:DNA-binding domain of Mlu1-box binding protein MBP1 [Cryphonectria parasitica EP155]|uniref:DNA-binding domain of Mlu1-box binding protein MBP1 n=1 Tax=Cryphonectria parasitica (strain ATCC 38755 / EP155) TaxID=660469 RepID=A0A9P4Y540_CRYP1|nr:DNA-binding domain of Mlu1-box binding protein MBP1 [Cryphonectria parasitica EP155]KAF3767092.1 DNA-binding domain of Mlu1-box binding protein MBP1 [Cryphonectria parasitica EP155]